MVQVEVWLGWAYFPKKVREPWHQGACFNLPTVGLYLHVYYILYVFCASTKNKKCQGTAKSARAVLAFDLCPEPHAKKRFWAPQVGFGGAIPYTRTKT